MADVKLSGLVKKFGRETVAVDTIDLHFRNGEFVFLLGPSGCGKTTTLRMIAGLEMPTGGRVEIGDRNVTFLRPRHRNVGMVFQDYGLYRHMSVFENIAYPLRVRKLSRADIERKVGEVAATLKIGDLMARKPDQLAGGQLQRVAIARMLVRDANVFLMDEPMSHLDAALREHMRAELKHLQKQIGTTTIFVTHDQLEAMTMADRIVIMKAGKILQTGSPQQIFERPANLFVATFVGEPQMNIVDATLQRSSGGIVASGAGFELPLDAGVVQRTGLDVNAGRPVKLGIRPEHISIAREVGEVHSTPARMFAFEATGPETLFTLNLGPNLVTVRAPTDATTADIDLADGAVAGLRIDPTWLYIFDAASGETLAQAPAARADEDAKVVR